MHEHKMRVEMMPIWDKAEAAMRGAHAVKAGGDLYLPRYGAFRDPGESDINYQNFLDDAEWCGSYDRIAQSVVGLLARNPPEIQASNRLKNWMENVDARGKAFWSWLVQDILPRVVGIGYEGVMVDNLSDGITRPVLRNYSVQSWLNWKLADDGLDWIVLNEQGDSPKLTLGNQLEIEPGEYHRHRALHRESGSYGYAVYDVLNKGSMVESGEPKVLGSSINHVPFFAVGYTGDGFSWRPPPMAGLLNTCFADYKLSAKEGRMVLLATAPVHYASGVSQPDADEGGFRPELGMMTIQTFRSHQAKIAVSEVDAAVLDRVDAKRQRLERRKIALGAAYLSPDRSAKTAREASIQNSGDLSFLEQVAGAMSTQATAVVREVARWLGASDAEVDDTSVEMSRSFYDSQPEPTYLLAISTMMQQGTVSVDDAYITLHNLGMIDPEIKRERWVAETKERLRADREIERMTEQFAEQIEADADGDA